MVVVKIFLKTCPHYKLASMKTLLISLLWLLPTSALYPNAPAPDAPDLMRTSAALTDFYVDEVSFEEIVAQEHIGYIRVWFLHWSTFNDEVRVFIDYGQMINRPHRSNVMTANGERINFNSKAHVINSLTAFGFELIQADTEEYYFRKK